MRIRKPAFVLAILTGLNLLNYIDRTVLAAVLPRIQAREALNLDDFQAGALATAFLVGYFATSPVFGAIADRAIHLRTKLMTIGVLVWSVATFLTGRAHDFPEMLAARVFVGVGEASYAAVAPTLIDEMAGPNRKGRLLAVFYLAIPIGSALGYMLGGFLEKNLGWRGAFYVVGGPGALLALSCLFIADDAPKQKKERVALAKMLAPLLREPLYVRAVIGYCAQTFALGGFSYWAPKYIHSRYRVELDRANYVFGGVVIVAGFLGTAIGGAWADRASRDVDGSAAGGTSRTPVDGSAAGGTSRTPNARDNAVIAHLRVCAVSGLLGAPFALVCLLTSTATGFFVFIFVTATFLFLSTSPINAALLGSVPVHLRASAMAMSIFATHLFGDLWSPPLVGAIAVRTTMQVGMFVLPVAILASGVVWFRLQPGTKHG